MNYLLLIINIILLVSGQMLWKVGVAKIGIMGTGNIISIIKSPYIIGGGIIYVFATGVWLYVLSRMPFSIAYPFQSLAYVLGVFIGFFIFKEVVTPIQWVGAVVIVFGVYLIAR